jgi:nucleoside-diphosphate-sugar epimerase
MNHPDRPAAGNAGVTVIGCGYTGRRLLKLCRDAGRDFFGTARSEDSLAPLVSAGAAAGILDLDAPGGQLPPAWTSGRALVYMAPPPDAGDADPRLRACLARIAAPPRALVYLSTTAVYGDAGGAVVDEDTPPAPESARGRRRLDAERAALDWGEATGVPVRVLRVPGIYGPERLPLDRLRQGAPVVHRAESGPGNRIHVDDLASVVLAAADYPGPERVFNVGDGNHASMSEYFLEVARLAGLPVPPELPLATVLAQVSPAMRGFMTESRRVDTRRMRSVLGFQPRYATLADGIRASLAG